jgi:hypothetical protein
VNGSDPDTPASYTNYGTSLVDVAAPGGRFAGGQDMVLSDSAHEGDLTGAQLQSTVEQTADDFGSPGTDPLFGRGRVNAFRAAMR